MLHSASLTDPTVAYSPYNPYVSHADNNHIITNGHQPCSPSGLSPASSAAVAALSAAVAVSAGVPPNVKDSRWLTLEVCRQYQRNQCSRDENECKFAHPPTHVDVQNGRVVCCYDSIKGKCQRRDPPCKYLHPPQHLREQLMQNGRNNMIIRNMQLQLFQQQILAQTAGILPFGSPPTVAACNSASANGVSNTNSIIYPGPGPLALGNPNASNAYSFLSMGFTPYLTALAGSHLNGVTGFSELFAPEPNGISAKRPISDSKSSTLYMTRTNGGARLNAPCDGTGKLDGQETSAPCVMVVSGNANVDSIKELNGSPHTVPVTIRSTTGNSIAPTTLYALQPPQGPNLLNLPVSHQPSQTIAPLTAASLAAVVNGNMAGGALAPGHFSAIPEHAAYFQPTYHIEIPPYSYQ